MNDRPPRGVAPGMNAGRVAVGLWLLVSAPALAQQPAEREAAARARFADGQRAYEAGDFPRAAQAFRAAYELHPSAELAFNVARVSERAGDVDVAIRYYELYV